MQDKKKFRTKDIVLIGVLAAILFVQEELLSFLPNIQLTVFLIVLYSKTIGSWKTCIIVVIHIILDNLVMGSFNIYTVPFMLIGWLIIPLTLGSIFKKVESSLGLAFLGAMYAFLYSWCFAVGNLLLLGTPFLVYLAADVIFELLLAGSSFLTILWLYDPLKKVIVSLENK